MADNSSIEWTDTTWNPIIGCTKVSPGCDHCYPIPLARIREKNPNPKVAAAFAGVVHQTEHGLDWTGRVNLLPERLGQPLKWRRPRRVFVNSLADLFHEQVPDDFIAQVFAVMALAKQHTFQVLTKRHGRMRSLLNSGYFVAKVWGEVDKRAPGVGAQAVMMWPSMPLPNVWLGVSVENQKWADLRIPALLGTPAAVRWISAEPLLGQIDVTAWLGPRCRASRTQSEDPYLDWVVAGGESGPGARPAHPDWFRSLRDQCQQAGVPFLFKQRGAYTWQAGSGWREPDLWVNDVTSEALPERDLPSTPKGSWKGIWRVGKKRAGRELDGRTWDEFPDTTAAGVR